ncbi:Beta-barrel assembly-enhancing protease [uncultured archaeon]|nr:Beta-barrel assembly-enhancing protease [uncultured archaeon]
MGDVAYRINLMSAIFAALTAATVYLLAQQITKAPIPSATAGLAYAFTPINWSQPTTAEVYTLHGHIVALVGYLLFRWQKEKNPTLLYATTLTFGLGLAHHVSMAILTPAFLYVVWKSEPRIIKEKARLLRLVLVASIGPLMYFLLPIRAALGAKYVWDRPDTVEGFIATITLKTHRSQHFINFTATESVFRVFGLLKLYVLQFSFAGLLAVFGFMRWRKYRLFFEYTLLLTACETFYATYLNAVSFSTTAFGIPALTALAVWIAIGLDEARTGLRKRTGETAAKACAILLAILTVTLLLASGFNENDRSGTYLPRDYETAILNQLPPNATLFTQGDSHVFMMYYLNGIEKIRPDVHVVDRIGLMTDFYGSDFPRLPLNDRVNRFLEREEAEAKSGHPVYYTAKAGDIPPAYKLVQEGLVYRLIQKGQNYTPTDPWSTYKIRGLGENIENSEDMVREMEATYYLRKSEYNKNAGRANDAEKDAEEAAKIGYDIPGVQHNVGLLYLGLQNNNALPALAKSVEIDPTNAGAWEDYGYALVTTGNYTTAEYALKQALTIDPTLRFARQNLAGLYFTTNRDQQALNEYQILLKEYPQYALPYKQIGVILYNNGKAKEAVKYFNTALQLSPNDPDAEKLRAAITQQNATTPT